MTDGVRTLAGFLRFIDIDARAAAAHPDAFDRLRAGDLQAVMVHGVYEPQVLEEIGERLERHDPPFLKTWFPKEFRSWFYGRNLNLAHPSLAGYFEEARQFHADLDALFPSGCGLLARVGGILAQLDHGRPFVPAPGPDPDRHYMFTTLRAHMEEGFIPPHLDNEQALRPSYSHLRTMVERHMTSFVLMLKAPESGGTLDVFDYVCDPEDAVPMNRDDVAQPDFGALEPASFPIPAGSMIVLDSGRYLHRLSPVSGPRKRWTACSFMALSRRREATYCWG
jgi:hypothetical protein